MIDQGMGGDIVYICSKNGVFAGPNNVAYGAAKADQAHQVRLLAAELGEHGIRVNGINPDGVVRGSGIFAKGWGAQRAAVYGVPEEELGAFYAQRTLLEARGAARARRGGRVRAHRRRSRPDDRPAHSRRCRRRRRRSCADPCRRSSPSTSAPRAGASSTSASTGRDRARRRAPLPDRGVPRPGGTRHLGLRCAARDVRRGVAAAVRRGDVASVAVDAWGVDYGLLDRSGRLLGPVHAYRSSRTDGVMDAVVGDGRPAAGSTASRASSSSRSTRSTSSSPAAGDAGVRRRHERLLMVPDLVNHELCGSTTNDVTNASTTQLLDVSTEDVERRAGSPRSGCAGTCCPPLHEPGRARCRAASTARSTVCRWSPPPATTRRAPSPARRCGPTRPASTSRAARGPSSAASSPRR